ncbi:MAG: cell division protein FtsQ/DivIB [Gammaproteobacteria bacterium]
MRVDDRRLLRPETRNVGVDARRGFSMRALLVLFVAGALAVASGRLLDPRTLPVKSVRVQGEFFHLSPQVLQERAKDTVWGGFFNVNVDAVRSALLADAWVDDVAVRRVWPDALDLQVREQIAVAVWRGEALINDRAILFRPDPATFPPGLPVLSGPEGTAPLVLDRFRYLQHTLSARGLNAIELVLNERRAWTFRLAEGPSVNLGRGHFVERLERFVAAVPDELAGRLHEIEMIDMRYTNGFAVRWQPDSARDPHKMQETYGKES